MGFSLAQSKFLDTIDMIEKYRLSIRTVTVGISLLEYSCSEMGATAQAVYDHIAR